MVFIQAAGSRNVIDLHGRVDVVRCLELRPATCRATESASRARRGAIRAFAELDGARGTRRRRRARGHRLRGVRRAGLRSVRRATQARRRVFRRARARGTGSKRAFAALEQSDALLVVGSSLMVYSGYRFRARGGRHRQADRSRQSRPHPRRRFAHAEGYGTLLGGAGVSAGSALSSGSRGRNSPDPIDLLRRHLEEPAERTRGVVGLARFKPVRNDEVVRAQAIRLNSAHLRSRCCHDVAAHLE